jgi:hypothetical protein
MDKDTIKSELMKQARNAFETACTIRDEERIEVYLYKDEAKVSDVLTESDEIIYGPERTLCYQVFGHDYLEAEIKTWIDYARVLPQPGPDEIAPEPTDIEKSIRELVDEIAKSKGVSKEQISSFEVFANLPVNLLGSIEQQIIEYWWNGDVEENAKMLAEAQIEEALAQSGESLDSSAS